MIYQLTKRVMLVIWRKPTNVKWFRFRRVPWTGIDLNGRTCVGHSYRLDLFKCVRVSMPVTNK